MHPLIMINLISTRGSHYRLLGGNRLARQGITQRIIIPGNPLTLALPIVSHIESQLNTVEQKNITNVPRLIP